MERRHAAFEDKQNAISDASDSCVGERKIERSDGVDVHTQFRVAAIGDADTDLATPEAMEAPLSKTYRMKKAKLQAQQANYDARAKKAEYISMRVWPSVTTQQRISRKYFQATSGQ